MKLYVWKTSPYSAKVRAYLQWKGVAFEEIAPSARMLYGTIQKAVGRMIMPTILRPDGTWMQDSSDIIDAFEADEPAITPPGPTQRVANLLLELHGDEWLPMVMLHYRWNRPVNRRFAMTEFARDGLPWIPRPLGRLMIRPMADRLSGYLPVLGVDETTIPGVEGFTADLLKHLDAHFAEHPYVFGGRPALADFAVFGPLWAHLFRDPDTTSLFDDHPHVRGWMDRLLDPPAERGEFLPDDAVPATLDPVFRTLFAEQWPFVLRLADAIDAWCADHPDATRVPRSLGPAPFVVGGREGTRKLITFSWWMVQRALDAHAAEPADPAWLARVGGGALSRDVVHRFERHEFKMRLAR